MTKVVESHGAMIHQLVSSNERMEKMLTLLVQQGSPSPTTRRKRSLVEMNDVSSGNSLKRCKLNENDSCAAINGDSSKQITEDGSGSRNSELELENQGALKNTSLSSSVALMNSATVPYVFEPYDVDKVVDMRLSEFVKGWFQLYHKSTPLVESSNLTKLRKVVALLKEHIIKSDELSNLQGPIPTSTDPTFINNMKLNNMKLAIDRNKAATMHTVFHAALRYAQNSEIQAIMLECFGPHSNPRKSRSESWKGIFYSKECLAVERNFWEAIMGPTFGMQGFLCPPQDTHPIPLVTTAYTRILAIKKARKGNK